MYCETCFLLHKALEFVLHAFDERQSYPWEVTCEDQHNLFAASQELLNKVVDMKFTAINTVNKKVRQNKFLRCASEQLSSTE